MNERINSVDILRGLATIHMIIYHSYAILTGMNYGLFGDIIFHLAQLIATIFIIVSGSSLFLFIEKQLNAKLSKKSIFNIVFKRASFIIIVVTLFQLIYGLIFPSTTSSLIHWSVFHIIGISMIIFFLVPFLKRNFRIMIYLVFIPIIFILGHVIIDNDIILLQFLVAGGEFPILPWINFFIFGLFIGDLLANLTEKELYKTFYIFIPMGLILVIIWFFWVIKILYLFIHQFVWSIGAFLIAFPILFYFTDIKMYNSRVQRRIIEWGKTPFSIYYIHIVILLSIKIIFPYVYQLFHMGLISIPNFIIFVFIFTLILEIFLRIWKKFDYKYGMEWSMRRFAQFSFINK